MAMQAKARQAFAATVRANDLRFDQNWGAPCCAYNLYIPLGAQAADSLVRAQEMIGAEEPLLLQVPRHALHINVAWVLPVHQQSTVPKPEIWQASRESWQPAIRRVLAEIEQFTITFRTVIPTDTAVIALADPPVTVNRVRKAVAEAIDVPWEICRGDLVHTTLFRYGGPLRQPDAFLARLAGLELSAPVDVSELLLVREDKFPSLEYEVLETYRLTVRGEQHDEKETTDARH
jgi:2'-5' RNA ligase superfamily protein